VCRRSEDGEGVPFALVGVGHIGGGVVLGVVRRCGGRFVVGLGLVAVR
jgi:hypothetical protein